MDTAEEILLDELNDVQTKLLEETPRFKEWVLEAMKLYANAKLDEAAELAYQDTHDGYAAPAVKRHVLSLKDKI